jgi:hypothetical protein
LAKVGLRRSWRSTCLTVHPASGKSPIKLVTAADHPTRSAKAFYSSQTPIWPAIFAGADASRDELTSGIDAIKDRAISEILISGPSGAAKGNKYAFLTINPFVNYNFGGGWFVGTVPIITANLDAGGPKWTLRVWAPHKDRQSTSEHAGWGLRCCNPT